MGLKCGIVGLPNVGKSTLFNALTSAKAEASNYPFCTIEPNMGMVKVPDPRLDALCAIVKPNKVIPAIVEFVDIAGLVKGASQGEGLGNKFLGHIKEVDAIVHVVRCFESTQIIHVAGKIAPLEDIDVIETELMLKDLETVENRINKSKKGSLGKEKELLEFFYRVKELLEKGTWLSRHKFSKEEKDWLQPLFLISMKPVLFACNISETDIEAGTNTYVEQVREKAQKDGSRIVAICSRIEEEISQLESDEEKKEFLESMGLKESGLNALIREGYDLLGLQTYFTAGVQEVRAWTIRKGDSAPMAAGVIHTDFQKGFICAEIIAYDDYVRLGGEHGAKEAGVMRLEGKEYIMRDGDVVHFRFNV